MNKGLYDGNAIPACQPGTQRYAIAKNNCNQAGSPVKVIQPDLVIGKNTENRPRVHYAGMNTENRPNGVKISQRVGKVTK